MLSCYKTDTFVGSDSHPDQHHICGLYGHICPGSYGDAHVSHGQSGRVVDAVTHHGDPLSCLLQLFHFGHLVGGQHLSEHFPDAHLVDKKQNDELRNQTRVGFPAQYDIQAEKQKI